MTDVLAFYRGLLLGIPMGLALWGGVVCGIYVLVSR